MKSSKDCLVIVIGILGFFAGRWASLGHDHREIDHEVQEPSDGGDVWEGYLDEQTYRNHKQVLIDGQAQASQDFDKYLVTLAAGALGLSIAFIRQIAPNPVEIWSIIVAWSAFGASLISILLSFWFSQRAFHRAEKVLDTQNEEDRLESNWWDYVTTALNVISVFSFVAGVVFLAYFAASNTSTSM